MARWQTELILRSSASFQLARTRSRGVLRSSWTGRRMSKVAIIADHSRAARDHVRAPLAALMRVPAVERETQAFLGRSAVASNLRGRPVRGR